jgi:hypothetical protein
MWDFSSTTLSQRGDNAAAAASQQSFDEKELSIPQLQCPVYLFDK